MYFFYIDETGNRDPRTEIPQGDGTTRRNDWLYVLTAVCLFEKRWHGFEKSINRHKAMLMDQIHRTTGLRLELADCELKSNWVRIPRERRRHPFISRLTPMELTRLIDLYYRQLPYHHMWIFSVIVDKRYLHDYMDQEKLHRKSWELLAELIERFMRGMHPKHQAIMIVDDTAKRLNQSLAMKHAYLQDRGTTSGLRLTRICEMPMFVRSELSNGIQLADFCSYNIYRSFKTGDFRYGFFERIGPRIWSSAIPLHGGGTPFSGLCVFPAESPLQAVAARYESERAPSFAPGALEN